MANQSGKVEDRANTSREQVGDIKHRKRLSTLSEEELAALREAFRLAKEISDSRGFGHFASLHGFPEPGYCEHENQLFLPWHRGYLYYFEQSLQDLVPGVTLPWWDWTEGQEIPGAYAAEKIRRANRIHCSTPPSSRPAGYAATTGPNGPGGRPSALGPGCRAAGFRPRKR